MHGGQGSGGVWDKGEPCVQADGWSPHAGTHTHPLSSLGPQSLASTETKFGLVSWCISRHAYSHFIDEERRLRLIRELVELKTEGD